MLAIFVKPWGPVNSELTPLTDRTAGPTSPSHETAHWRDIPASAVRRLASRPIPSRELVSKSKSHDHFGFREFVRGLTPLFACAICPKSRTSDGRPSDAVAPTA